MRLMSTSHLISFDITLFEPLEDTESEPATDMVAGGAGGADLWTAPPAADPTQQVPEDRAARRRPGVVGFTG